MSIIASKTPLGLSSKIEGPGDFGVGNRTFAAEIILLFRPVRQGSAAQANRLPPVGDPEPAFARELTTDQVSAQRQRYIVDPATGLQIDGVGP